MEHNFKWRNTLALLNAKKRMEPFSALIESLGIKYIADLHQSSKSKKQSPIISTKTERDEIESLRRQFSAMKRGLDTIKKQKESREKVSSSDTNTTSNYDNEFLINSEIIEIDDEKYTHDYNIFMDNTVDLLLDKCVSLLQWKQQALSDIDDFVMISRLTERQMSQMSMAEISKSDLLADYRLIIRTFAVSQWVKRNKVSSAINKAFDQITMLMTRMAEKQNEAKLNAEDEGIPSGLFEKSQSEIEAWVKNANKIKKFRETDKYSRKLNEMSLALIQDVPEVLECIINGEKERVDEARNTARGFFGRSIELTKEILELREIVTNQDEVIIQLQRDLEEARFAHTSPVLNEEKHDDDNNNVEEMQKQQQQSTRKLPKRTTNRQNKNKKTSSSSSPSSSSNGIYIGGGKERKKSSLSSTLPSSSSYRAKSSNRLTQTLKMPDVKPLFTSN